MLSLKKQAAGDVQYGIVDIRLENIIYIMCRYTVFVVNVFLNSMEIITPGLKLMATIG